MEDKSQNGKTLFSASVFNAALSGAIAQNTEDYFTEERYGNEPKNDAI